MFGEEETDSQKLIPGILGNALDKQDLFNEPLYNLIYLEVAACRLSALPPTFSQMLPNLRALNLNYNFLADVAKPLVGLTRLRKLTIVGSRLKASKSVVRMLQRMPEMEQFDARYAIRFFLCYTFN